MSSPVSQPVTPPQPDQMVYGLDALALFPSFTRDSYLAAFGVQAPPYDPTRLIKTWFDSTVDLSNPANVAIYKIAAQDPSGNWGLQQMVLPAQEAAAVNLTGSVAYPAYVIASTNATRGGTVINPEYLSLQQDAQALMTAIGGTSLVDEGASPVFPVVYPPNDPRRLWDIIVNGQPFNAGALLAEQNANGTGSPGHWDTASGTVVWVPDAPAPTGLNDTRPPRPMPLRDLLPNEQFQAGLMGVGILRTDLAASNAQANGQFTADDRATLGRIYHIVNNLDRQ